MTNPTENDASSSKSALFGSVGAAIGAAVCCLGPVILVSLGVTGAWIGRLSALEPFRPLFAVVAAGFLGYGFYRVYGRPASDQVGCGEDAECDVPSASRINKVSLWIATVVVVALFASPYLFEVGPGSASTPSTAGEAESAVADDSEKRSDTTGVTQVVLTVEGMTCSGCTTTVQTALERVEGVEEAHVSLEPPRARVMYKPSEVSIEALTEATANVGYPTTPTN